MRYFLICVFWQLVGSKDEHVPEFWRGLVPTVKPSEACPQEHINKLIIWILSPLVVKNAIMNGFFEILNSVVLPRIKLIGLILKNNSLLLILETTSELWILKKNQFINVLLRGTLHFDCKIWHGSGYHYWKGKNYRSFANFLGKFPEIQKLLNFRDAARPTEYSDNTGKTIKWNGNSENSSKLSSFFRNS